MSSHTEPSGDLVVDVERTDGADVVRVRGDLDLFGHMKVRRVLIDARVCAQTEVVLDMTEVGFLDSMGISAIVAGHRRLAARAARLSVACPDGTGREILRSTGIDQVVTVYPTVRKALAGVAVTPL